MASKMSNINHDYYNRRFDSAEENETNKIKTFFKHFWKCIVSDPIFKKQMTKRANPKGINSVSQCDRISRIIFPMSFLLLNILYWKSYYKYN